MHNPDAPHPLDGCIFCLTCRPGAEPCTYAGRHEFRPYNAKVKLPQPSDVIGVKRKKAESCPT